MGILAKIRRMYFREKVPLREIARRTGLSRNTVRSWLRQTDAVEPKYPKRVSPSVVDKWAAQLTGWLRADSHRPKRDRRTARFMLESPPSRSQTRYRVRRSIISNHLLSELRMIVDIT